MVVTSVWRLLVFQTNLKFTKKSIPTIRVRIQVIWDLRVIFINVVILPSLVTKVVLHAQTIIWQMVLN